MKADEIEIYVYHCWMCNTTTESPNKKYIYSEPCGCEE